jgi:hypothetical protein
MDDQASWRMEPPLGRGCQILPPPTAGVRTSRLRSFTDEYMFRETAPIPLRTQSEMTDPAHIESITRIHKREADRRNILMPFTCRSLLVGHFLAEAASLFS